MQTVQAIDVLYIERLPFTDWRMEKKQRTQWTKQGAQMLLDARCALVNGQLNKHSAWSPQHPGLRPGIRHERWRRDLGDKLRRHDR
jgi:hypothetical protein